MRHSSRDRETPICSRLHAGVVQAVLTDELLDGHQHRPQRLPSKAAEFGVGVGQYSLRMRQQVSSPVFAGDPPSEGLREDLLTDWVPDALGGYGVEPEASHTPGTWIDVSDGSHMRRVPIPRLEFRVWASQSVEPSLASAEVRLGPEVFGYRDATTSYRLEHARYRATLRELEGTGIAIHLDVRDFFRSVSPKVCRTAGLVDEPTYSTMVHTQRVFGTALLSGTRWSRRVGNLLLRPLDDRIRESARFVRWQDDVTAYVSTEEQGRQLVVSARQALSGLGLRLNEQKLTSKPAQPHRTFLDVAGMPPSERHAQLDRLMTSDLTSLSEAKRLVRGFAEATDPNLLPHVYRLTRTAPGLAPRIAMYVAALADANIEIDQVAEALTHGITEHDLWVQSRLVAAACHHPALAMRVLGANPAILGPTAPSWVSDLAARCRHAAAEAFGSPSLRVTRALESHDWAALRKALPVTTTTL